ncbi:assimilatory sulfite reductase (NADPH) flavoprotein subunit [Paenalcaligenes niemegkensis]|uniref:assimilatory sulfite reductase (NADPH) flavoprotein subunit n=1 Tax=Paenalcaligenes niemegkensis TaxID=2895469 RepID=UPI001EE88568|nr:assimilatory sulfite reductase (NADPH) flavoprotein subunit [Paenalcaligenes niemegkensis]MCQ9617793.1 assimilatory sulfite reductase (NADPH) flavoprotein subunit [Paenalcaligenes niemegkensis]
MLALSRLPDTAQGLINELTRDLDSQTLTWLSGYLAGAAQVKQSQIPPSLAAVPAPASAPAAAPSRPATILFGSQTGNAERIATEFHEQCQQAGLNVRLVRADRYATRELKDEELLFIVISTQGEGDPPDDSVGFVEFLAGRRAPKLENLNFGILGLGDSSYPLFCGIAETIEKRLVELGAKKLLASGLADLDIETVASPWKQNAVELAKPLQVSTELETPVSIVTTLHPQVQSYTRDNPFRAALLEAQPITGRGSSRDVRHFELSLEGSKLNYQPGDSLGVWPIHDSRLVDAVLAQTGIDGEESVTVHENMRTVREWLSHYRELTQLTKPFLVALAQRNSDPELALALSPDGLDAFRELLGTHQLLDALKRFPAEWDAESLVHALRPLAPRMYSIASSQSLVDDEVHLTVANVQYEFNNEERWGAASNYLSNLAEGDEVLVFVDTNSRFRLPEDHNKDVIMIGPGTGVAPFRAFVQERNAQEAKGRNWLFFGNPNFTTDFLYQTEWLRAIEDGQLERLDVAFSRDQEEKVYVQHKLLENATDVYEWIQSGAHIYVCGDADYMAKDVHSALQKIAQLEGGLDEDAARQWIDELSVQGRYARDVY